jgi:glycosyltransferase involved in cell wall biosynthesis
LAHFFQAEPLSRADYGFDEDDVLLIYTGRLGPEKNLEFLLRSFSGISQALENVRLLLVGDGPLKEDLKDLARELQITASVQFIGQIPYDKLPGYLAMCDLFVTASVTEVHPLSVIEAMAACLPVMGIHSPGVGDTVKDGVTGLLSMEDLSAFTAKLTRLCLQKQLRQKMGRAARKASNKYAIERTTQMMQKHYERLTSGPRPHKLEWEERLLSIMEHFRV